MTDNDRYRSLPITTYSDRAVCETLSQELLRRLRSLTRAGCAHSAAHVVAVLAGDAGAELGPTGAGSRWWALDNASEPTSALGDLGSYRADVYLGVCSACRASVVSVRTWDAEHCGPGCAAWSSPWVALVPDGNQ